MWLCIYQSFNGICVQLLSIIKYQLLLMLYTVHIEMQVCVMVKIKKSQFAYCYHICF